ncbi:MAG: carboxypeptidase-like regulatory domain-containing protein [Gemmataceae bacterium]|nr:carboxypeptidase-like regulatory domain-containing protein [Gemmataceae bacterium]
MFLLVGCGPNFSELGGNVTFNGTPLRYGQISLFNEKKEVVASGPIIEGNYVFPGLAPGQYTLTVATVGPFGEAVGFETPTVATRDPRDRPPPVPAEVKKSMLKEKPEVVQKAIESLTPIPLKYASVESSDLKVTVAGSKTAFDVALSGKGERLPMPKFK